MNNKKYGIIAFLLASIIYTAERFLKIYRDSKNLGFEIPLLPTNIFIYALVALAIYLFLNDNLKS
ncbi:hypothetical protein CIW83_03060 [Tissierella sp. P1]|nr:hypothetical protein CIW83_03060 [Tissierella sp. P1]